MTDHTDRDTDGDEIDADIDTILRDLHGLDPEAYAAGQARLAARDRRLELFESLERERGSISQTLVAARMGTSQSAVARLEGGLTDPKLSTLERYANAIDRDLQVSLAARAVDSAVRAEQEHLAAIATSTLNKRALAAAALLGSALAIIVAIAMSRQGKERLTDVARLLREAIAAQGQDPEEFIETLQSVLGVARSLRSA